MDEARLTKRVLFLCTGNSARSQMAEALLPLIAGQHFQVFSAGTQPVGLNPSTVEAMRDLGVDISHQRSKHLEEFLGEEFDYVITVCDRAKERVPSSQRPPSSCIGVLKTQQLPHRINEVMCSGACAMKLPTNWQSLSWKKGFCLLGC